ncbi:MAG TPA: sodium-translocating pyrophosphatase [Fermentimonas caenicola]|jgi:K(+)-stimulated pyrophosphate-energized sodium pump|uniref:Putative K(+)-stimulated pyrophosphate-energized sodium pump n=1 Tax=Fermentimonas caenicola TaxID=1562970 RepID=A0A098C0V6_9BACT|nr:sodium-translocating pyrophosphatase [Lascolabacillus sp.]MBP6175826.1 sodium-translocating pyrophosphatase [Fermentimonas sp.]MDI9626276.1 sodium-translocating pyrophosphatase [Bacteroidota bacterium]TAH61415.1 MAG: sodium-translocating pyrophosphatase [Fermentimonas caenicola]MBP6196563.1 sodium-translocating pyrophosphatase [Fermentimonas sp.]MBP7104611.1 sodium-translocating pyrophosphatase [Fermentimonas sp.]
MNYFYLVPIASIAALLCAFYFFRSLMKKDEGTPKMKTIAGFIREGAMSYLKQQYKVVIIVFIILSLIFVTMSFFGLQNKWVPFAFLTGGFFSGLAGFFGMKTATYASARTANAVQKSLNSGLRIAFRSGAVMGLVVVGLALLDISLWYLILDFFVDNADHGHKLIMITTTMLTFGMGASTQALFARVGGGIYTKAADVGADLVGKVETGIPEDDPRNPATIADNVGDNVGDVAGMGADLYESYCGSILSTAALGASAFALNPTMQENAVFAPMLIAAIGVFLSILGIYLVKTKEDATVKQLMDSLNRGVNISALFIAIFTFGILYILGFSNWIGLSFSVITGLLAGIIIGQGTEYFTSSSHKPAIEIANSAKTGPATVIISGLGTGFISTVIPVLSIVVAILIAYLSAIRFDVANMLTAENVSMGLYGIAIAAVGMLSTLGITLATDAYGPIADNAGGIAEMSGLDPEVRRRTDMLDSLGNTTAATGKGFAIGSAALTGLALLASYVEEIRVALLRVNDNVLEFADGHTVDVAKASFVDFMNYYQVTLMNPKVLAGIFLGSMMVFLFCGLTMNAVGRTARNMVEEVRYQFREFKGILTGEDTPDYARCVSISTKGAQREMLFPSLLAVTVPIVTGLIMGVSGVMGLLAGGLGTGFVMAIFMANSGGAWDNAKKYIEMGNLGGKGSHAHKAAVVGDTVGDPFKDTSGPSLNILIKLMSMVSIVMAGLTVAWSLL